MADLGNLYFDILFRDKTAEQRKKIKADILKDLDVKLDLKVGVSKTDLIKSAREALAEKEFKVGVSVDHSDVSKKVQAAFDGKTFKIGIESRKSDLAKSIRESLKGEAFKVGVIIDKASASQAVQEALRKAGLNTNYSASDLRATRARAVEAKAEAYINSQRELARQRAAAAAKAELGLATARERSANAARAHASATLNMNGAMRSQLSITGELANQMLGLYSIYTLERFIRGLVDIGGEFEQQELALSAMLNDAGKAHEIFGSIKNLAVVSPFGVRELNDYTKQLKAFSIPYNELYETTKRLADISAGVGVDMGRIILAYGQVRSAAFLRGQELRQFTEAGIPMVEALADKFSKLENRVISAGEVIDMISKKKVSFEDVKDVLWGMTDDGGKFHNMQEVLSESLSAKWKNLEDAIDIMMADIAESMNGTLKGTAEMLTELTSSWKSLVPVIHSAIIAFGTYKVATFANSKILSSEYANTVKSILSKKQQEAAILRVASAYRTLSVTEQFAIRTSGKMTLADYEQMAKTGMLTKNKLLYLAAIGKITTKQAEYIAISAKMGVLDTQQINKLTFLRVGVMQLRNALQSVGIAMKSLLFNPYTIAFAGISAIMELVHKSEQKEEDIKQRIKDISQTANEGFKSLNSEAKKFADIDPFNVKESSLITSIDKIKEVLKDYSPVWKDTFNDVFAVDNEGKQINSLAEQYEKLRDSLNNVKEGYKVLAEIKNVAEFANSDTDGWLDESFAENLKDASNAYAEMEKRVGNITTDYAKYYEAMQKVLESNKDFAKVANGTSLQKQLMLLRVFPKALKDFGDYTRDAQGNYNVMFIKFNESVLDYKKNLDIAGKDLHGFMESYKSRLRGLGLDLDKLSEPQKIAIALNVTQFMDTIEGLNPELRKIFLRESLEREFKIKVTAEFEDKVKGLTQIQEKFDEATNNQFTAQIKTSTDPNEIIDNIQKAYKEADSAVKQMKPILLKFGVKFDKEGKADIDSAFNVAAPWIKSMAEEYNKRQNEIIGGNSGATILGFPVKDVKDSKKDIFAEQMKERVNLLKDAYSEYKKWKGIVGKEEASNKIKGSGIFDSLFKGKEPVDIDNYREELNKLLSQLDNKTKERRELKVSIRKVLLDIDANAVKEASEKALSDMERYISNITKKWNIYQQLINAGASKKDASTYAFGFLTDYENEAQYLIDTVQKKLKEKGVDLPFTLSDDEAESILGGKDSPLYKQFFKVWKDAKEAFEKDKVSIALDDTKVIANARSTIEKIRILSEQYASKTGLSVGKNGELVGDTSGLNNVQKAYLDEYNKKLIELKSTLLQLLPEWEKIFGDKDQRSFSDLKEAERIAREIKNNAKVSYDSDGKPNGFTSFFTKDDGSIENVKGAYSLLDKLIKAIPQLQDAQLAVNPFKTLAKNVKELFTSEKDSDKLEKKIGRLGESAAESAQLVGTFAGQMSDMFDALGNEGAADSMGNVQDAMTSISNIGQGFAKGGIVGGIAAAAGEAVNWIGKIAQAHDKKLDKAIEKSKERVQHLKNVYEQIDAILERTLGSGTELKLIDAENDKVRLNQLNGQIDAIRNKGKINIFDMMSLSKYAAESAKLQKRVKAYNEGGAYGYQRALMQEQLSEVEQQRRDELDKKKTDNSKVEDYNNQIAELKQQIKDFAEDAADSLYGINLKDWASQLGDALYEAWQKGEDGAEAFKKKAAEIMGDVMNSVLKLAILEPAMKNLQTMLFGEDGMSGMFGSDFSLDDSELESIADYLMGVSSKTDDYYDALDKLNEYMEKKYGISMKEEAESSGLSKGIEGVTEDTANLLASYLNSVRADVAAKLVLVRQIVDEYFPRANFLAEAQLTELKAISRNTANNVALVTEIRDMLSAARIDKNRGFYLK